VTKLEITFMETFLVREKKEDITNTTYIHDLRSFNYDAYILGHCYLFFPSPCICVSIRRKSKSEKNIFDFPTSSFEVKCNHFHRIQLEVFFFLIPRSHIHGIRSRKSHGLIPASSVATRTGQ
jgi:hypothetical protein